MLTMIQSHIYYFASIAGLWTARVLADHFEDVLIVEPEEWLSTEEGKSGVYNALGEAIEDARIHKRSRVFQYTSIHGMRYHNLKNSES